MLPRQIILLSLLALSIHAKTYDESHTVTINNLAGSGGLIEPGGSSSSSSKKKAKIDHSLLKFDLVRKLPVGCHIEELSLFYVSKCAPDKVDEYWFSGVHVDGTGAKL